MPLFLIFCTLWNFIKKLYSNGIKFRIFGHSNFRHLIHNLLLCYKKPINAKWIWLCGFSRINTFNINFIVVHYIFDGNLVHILLWILVIFSIANPSHQISRQNFVQIRLNWGKDVDLLFIFCVLDLFSEIKINHEVDYVCIDVGLFRYIFFSNPILIQHSSVVSDFL